MAQKRVSREECENLIAAYEECLEDGFPAEAPGAAPTALSECAKRLKDDRQRIRYHLSAAERFYDLRPDLSKFTPKPKPRVQFSIADIPDDGEPTAEELIEHLKDRFTKRSAAEDAKQLYQVAIHIDGPIGLAMVGDPHVDDNGTDWPALDRDVGLCKSTEGVFAIGLGDASNNWVGKLMGLYANQETTADRSLKLVEWLFCSIPWLLNVAGNHDLWHTDTADPLSVISRLNRLPGLYESHGARLQLNLPSGVSATVHARHDFPGQSQFNPAHALVRETLFGYRDHILACGHRHQAGYIPVPHNDPKRLCQGFRVGSYKKFDDFPKKKGFKDENWSPAMMAVIDPAFAHDPVRFIRPCFSIEEGCEYLTWRRNKFDLGSSAA